MSFIKVRDLMIVSIFVMLRTTVYASQLSSVSSVPWLVANYTEIMDDSSAWSQGRDEFKFRTIREDIDIEMYLEGEDGYKVKLWVDWSENSVRLEEGRNLLRIRWDDNGDRYEVTKSLNIDESNPYLSILGLPNGIARDDVKLSISTRDRESGVKEVLYKLTGATETNGWEKLRGNNIDIVNSGETMVEVVCSDYAGNIAYEGKESVKINRNCPPVITKPSENDMLFVEELIMVEWQQENSNQRKANVMFNDMQSGEITTFTVNGGERVLKVNPQELEPGRYEIVVEVEDTLGQKDISEVVSIRVLDYLNEGNVLSKELYLNRKIKYIKIESEMDIPSETSIDCIVHYGEKNDSLRYDLEARDVIRFKYPTDKVKVDFKLRTNETKVSPYLEGFTVWAK